MNDESNKETGDATECGDQRERLRGRSAAQLAGHRSRLAVDREAATRTRLGYGPKAAKERMRVALALDELPLVADSLAKGEQSYSAIKELTRVATANTQAEWCDAARGKNVRQVEEMVAGHRRGDRPTDPADPDLKPRVVRFEITTATLARLRQVQKVLADECGGHLEDDALIAALCDSILDGHAAADDGGRARHQILTTVCRDCEQARQQVAAVTLPLVRPTSRSPSATRSASVRIASRGPPRRMWRRRCAGS
jgi:hypothetical protein